MSLLDGFERKLLFGLTRLLALLTVMAVMLGAGVFIAWVHNSWPKPAEQQVSADEVLERLRARRAEEHVEASADGRTGVDENPFNVDDPLAGLLIPDNLLPEIAPLTRPGYGEDLLPMDDRREYREVMAGMLKDYAQSERQQYLYELSATVKRTEGEGLDRVDAIDEFMELKAQRLDDYRERLKRAEKERERAAIVGVAALALTALFSLVLVLLAIERNTRAARVQAALGSPSTERNSP